MLSNFLSVLFFFTELYSCKSAELPTVVCGNNTIEVEFSSNFVKNQSFINRFEFDSDDFLIYLSPSREGFDPTCLASRRDEGRYRFSIPFPFSKCGTKSRIFFNNSTSFRMIEYRNELWWKARDSRRSSIIPFHLHTITCIHTEPIYFQTAFKPKCCDPNLFTTSKGAIWMVITFRESSSDQSSSGSLAPPFDCLSEKKLYATVSVVRDYDVDMLVTSLICFISKSFDSDKRSNTINVFRSLCLEDTEEVKISKNKRRNEISFNFIPETSTNSTYFYLHCIVEVTKKTMGNNITSTPYKLKAVSGPVTLIRKPSLDVPPLERRDADSQSSATQKAETTTPGYNSVIAGWVVLLLLIISNLICVVIVGSLCYFLALQRHRRKRCWTGESLFNGFDIESFDIKSKTPNQMLCTPENKLFKMKCSTPKTEPDRLESFTDPRLVNFSIPSTSSGVRSIEITS